MISKQYDLAIIGSGFGGSLLAMIACRLGLSVLLLERGQHPRFAIGESTSPLTNLLIEELALRYDLPRLLPLTSFGPWQETYPEIVCGLKRGFTYYHQQADCSWTPDNERRNQLLVAASPNDRVADTHWLRSDVDLFLMQEAVAAGVQYHDRACIDPPTWQSDGLSLISGKTGAEGIPFATSARLIVDATGPNGYLHRSLGLSTTTFADYPPTQTLFSHFTGVRRCDQMTRFALPGGGTPPYGPDDAALHHVFDGGWMWVLRFGNGVTSAGIAVRDDLAEELRLSEGADAWERFLKRFPTVGEQFAGAQPVLPFIYQPRLSFRTSVTAGPGWVMLPSAAAFVDPLFSTGIPLTLLGIERISRALEESWGNPDFDVRLAEVGKITLAEADATAAFISGCYAGMARFRLFSTLSMFYFAAASFSEMTRRLDRRHLVRRFLASDHPQFGRALHECAEWVCRNGRTASEAEIAAFEQRVAEGISCLNIAGLAESDKRNWYGVDLEDLVRSAAKLEMTAEDMQKVIATAPWATG